MPFQSGTEFPGLNTGRFVLSNEGLGIANDLSCSMSNNRATTTTYGCAETLPNREQNYHRNFTAKYGKRLCYIVYFPRYV